MTKVRPTRSPISQNSTGQGFLVETDCSPSAGDHTSDSQSLEPLQQRLPPIETLARPYEKNLPHAFDHLRQTHHQFRDYIAPKTPHVDHWKTAVYPQSVRYHGPTNFSTIFSDDKMKGSNDLLNVADGYRKHPGAVCNLPPPPSPPKKLIFSMATRALDFFMF